jgi:Zn-dependent M28 family amino/carboxypeptidase
VVLDFAERRRRLRQQLDAFLHDEGVLATLETDRRGDSGTVFAEGLPGWEPGGPVAPPSLVLAPEAYDRLLRLMKHGVPVKVGLEVAARFHDDAPDGQNVVAELPGRGRKGEVVMLGAHLDSWVAGTGATDNAAGVAVAMEAFRILAALGLPLERTVRLALWEGEEQGLRGSLGYVEKHFADPRTLERRPEHARLSAYFNIDNGSGKIRGVYLQGNDMVRPIFEQWLAPFRDLGATALTIRSTGGTDHQSFDAVGLPGFQFIQDPLDYLSRTHHSDLDQVDHAVPADLQQAAAVLATFVYQAANRQELLPRKPLPAPVPVR